MNTLQQAIEHRRSFYFIDNQSTVSDKEIRELVEFAVRYTPSAFNSQSSRAVVLLHQHHEKFWQIVKNTLRGIVPPESFANTEKKINSSFSCGYGTILFFEDTSVVENLQKSFPLYADNFPIWSEQTSGILQFTIWTLLEDAGLGASLQHYNPLIDSEVRSMWHLPESWQLRAQMPFGTPKAQPDAKEFLPVEERVKMFE
ncbi:nitroreductase [Bacteroidia bacterium]|nr:nitroreductase [Bacteroidia bacterium]